MRPLPFRILTRRWRLTTALVVAGCVAPVLGWGPVAGDALTSPSLITSTSWSGLSALSNAAQTSVTQATPLISRLASADDARAGSRESGAAAGAAELLERMNGARIVAGAGPLLRDPALDAVAKRRAEDLLALNYFGHYGPGGESAFTELRSRGIRYHIAGENLARNNHSDAETAVVAFESLMASPGHRANILEPRYHRAGVAAVPHGDLWLYVTIFTD